MDFFELTQARHSVRSYLPQPVEPKKLQQLLEAINRSPSAGNRQAYEVYVVTRDEQRQALAYACLGQGFIAQAPLDLVFCIHPKLNADRYGQRGADLYSLQDATIACTYAMLAATALGLSTVWVGAFDDDGVYQVIGAPAGQLPVAVLPVGYAAEEPRPRPRRRLSQLVHYLE
ncbi:MAG: nitroreductase family protein [Anaerolineales bacterium]|nr:nitroreductase family protein [Anaerolineales bacterium]